MTFADLRDAINELPPELLDCDIENVANNQAEYWHETNDNVNWLLRVVLKAGIPVRTIGQGNMNGFTFFDTVRKKEAANILKHWQEVAARKDIWDQLYNLIFSPGVSGKLHELFPDFDYVDPDASYEDDVRAYIRNFDWYANNEDEEDTE